MKLLLVVDKNFAIGLDGDQLVYIPDDLKRFKEFTLGNIMVMGRRTFEAMPGDRGLPGRKSIVMTSKEIEGVDTVKNTDQLFALLDKINPQNEKEVFCVGGAKAYESLYDYIDKAYITYVDKAFDAYDTKIDNLYEDKNFYVEEESAFYEYAGLRYKYVTFKRK